MSLEAISWVLRDVRGLSTGERVVLFVLADYADPETDECWPSVAVIADRCEMQTRSVKRNLRRLAEKGWLEVEQRRTTNGRSRSNLYTLRRLAGRVTETQGEGDRNAPLQGDRNAPPITLNPQKEPPQEKTPWPIPAELESWPGFWAAWQDWLEYRRKDRKRPVSQRAAQQQLKRLAEVGPTQAIAAIYHSIQNDYQGLFPDKFRDANKTPDRPGMKLVVGYDGEQRWVPAESAR